MPTRQEFLYFAAWEKALFYLLTALVLFYMGWQIAQRVRLWRTGRPIEWATLRDGRTYWMPTRAAFRHWGRNMWEYILAQKKVRSSRRKDGAPMHLLIFYGFLALFIATTLLGINTYSPWKFHQGTYYLVYEAVFDSLGLLLVVGLVWAIVRRAILSREGAELLARLRPKVSEDDPMSHQMVQNRRHPLSHHAADFGILALLLVITLTGYWLEAARISAEPKSWDGVSWVGNLLAQAQGPVTKDFYKGVWWFHTALVLGFFAVIPRLRIRHIVMAIFTAAGKPEQPMGRLRPVTMDEVEETEQVGVKLAKDYSRWHLMSLDACMECGRCTEVCPAWNVGKVLNPKQVVQDIRAAEGTEQIVADAVSEEALWQCTTCNACVEACPVLIRHVDLIVDARRNLVSEGALSGPAATMLRQTASTGHAWGAPAADREKWMEGLEIPLCRDGVEFEFLFWVGCAGATDPGAMRTTRAFAKLMKKAGVKFACLGKEEACTGDPARRVGEEFLFQEKAGQNVSTFERYGVKRVVTTCPHCMSTFRNEYGDFEGRLEVVHHTEMLAQLVREERLKPAKTLPGSTTYHDPCYLARVNGESEAPREALGHPRRLNDVPEPGPPSQYGLAEPAHHGRKTLCCGAGGGRMWMEEPADQRPSNRRAEELLATGADTVAVACPFCRIMLDAGLKQTTEKEVRLVDVAELMAEGNGG